MRKRNIGSALVRSESDHALVGIFTERDLLHKLELIQRGNRWNDPIRTVMNKNIVTLPQSRISEAGDLMMEKRFRHVPIVDNVDPNRVVGILSIREVLSDALVRLKRAMPLDNQREGWTQEALVTQGLDPGFEEYLRKRLSINLPGPRTPRGKTLIIDLDHIPTATWKEMLKNANDHAEYVNIIVVLDPILHAQNIVRNIEKLDALERWIVFTKPVGMMDFVNRLEQII